MSRKRLQFATAIIARGAADQERERARGRVGPRGARTIDARLGFDRQLVLRVGVAGTRLARARGLAAVRVRIPGNHLEAGDRIGLAIERRIEERAPEQAPERLTRE
jgi:hypothetical protein